MVQKRQCPQSTLHVHHVQSVFESVLVIVSVESRKAFSTLPSPLPICCSYRLTALLAVKFQKRYGQLHALCRRAAQDYILFCRFAQISKSINQIQASLQVSKIKRESPNFIENTQFIFVKYGIHSFRSFSTSHLSN